MTNQTKTKRIFFVTGLPRSRTAWLANFLTYGHSFCFHELSRAIPDARLWGPAFDTVDMGAVGTADSGLLRRGEEALAQFPQAALVIIERDPLQACESARRFLARSVDKIELASRFGDLQIKLRQLQNHCLATHRFTLNVKYEDLGRMEVCRDLWTYCTGEPFSERRWRELNKLNIQVKCNIAMEEAEASGYRLPPSDLQVSGFIPQPSAKYTRLQNEYHALLADLCKNTPGAFPWLQSLWEILLTWDHVEDQDPIDRPMANRAFESLMLCWPQNPFFQAHRDRLLPVLFNGISAWRHSNAGGPAVKGWDMYTEVPCTVAAIIGGMAAVNHYLPRIRALSEQIRGQHEKEGR